MKTLAHPSYGILLIAGLLVVVACKEDLAGPVNESAILSEQPLAKSGNIVSEFADSETFFEFNTTDNDLGLQIFLDAEGWDEVKVVGPQGQKIVQIMPNGPLRELGITELRFESAEPSPAEVLAKFSPGDYTFHGKTVDGSKLLSISELSHDFLPAATFTPAHGVVVDVNNAVVRWTSPGAEMIEVIIESEDSDNVFDVIVEAGLSSLTIPSEFLEEGLEYKIELLAYSENGNRTIVESSFVTND